MTPDPLNELLSPAGDVDASFRLSLREQTTRLVRRRLWRRRVGLAGAAAVIFLAGMGTMAWLHREQPGQLPIREFVQPPEQPKQPKSEPGPAVASFSPSPPSLEWQAFERAPSEKVGLLLAAGRKYLHEHNDYDSALRCYRQALDHADASVLDISPQDDWLIMALKIERRKEQ